MKKSNIELIIEIVHISYFIIEDRNQIELILLTNEIGMCRLRSLKR